ncbi:hypothetical protein AARONPHADGERS_283 [Bacillus phage AaronPhadgers]|nr:hypothetical protein AARONPHADGERS_283 [Bacillus phage AaronPhadgers]
MTVVRRQYDTLGFAGVNYVINEDETMVYKLESFQQMQMSKGFGLSVNIDLIAGWDYVETDYSNKQGWLSKEGFVETTHHETFTFYPMVESLKEALEEAGFKPLSHFDESRVHKFGGGEDE